VTIPADAPLSNIRETILSAGHTRYPVVGDDDPDQVVGFLDVKDVLRAIEEAGETTARELARGLLIVPETATADDLLLQFREERQQMAAVIDEWGALEGLATVEDVVEAVVGNLRDEFDVDEREPAIRRREDGGYDVDASVPLSAVNDALDAGFESGAFDTIGGLVLDRVGEVPDVGEEVEVAGYLIAVTAVEGNRISSVRVREIERDGGGSE